MKGVPQRLKELTGTESGCPDASKNSRAWKENAAQHSVPLFKTSKVAGTSESQHSSRKISLPVPEVVPRGFMTISF